MSLAVQDSQTEEIINWTPAGGLSNPYMNLALNNFIQLNLTSVPAGHSYNVNFLFWGSGTTPTFLSEVSWLINAGQSNLHPAVDVGSLAPTGTDQYFVRFRLFPTNSPGTVLTLDSITTSQSNSVPEPDSIVLGTTGLLFMLTFMLLRRRVAAS